MSVKERLAKAKQPVKPKFDLWIDGLDKDDREALEAAAVDPGFSNQAILEVVRAEGYQVGKDTVSAWRRARGYSR